MIYAWWCDVCGKKGATTMKPVNKDMTCLFCGHTLRIEVFSDVFLSLEN